MKKYILVEEVSITAFVSVVFAAILLGFIAHEAVHLLMISNASSLTIHFGASDAALSTCCLEENEEAYERIAYLVQLFVTIGWIILNAPIFIKEERP